MDELARSESLETEESFCRPAITTMTMEPRDQSLRALWREWFYGVEPRIDPNTQQVFEGKPSIYRMEVFCRKGKRAAWRKGNNSSAIFLFKKTLVHSILSVMLEREHLLLDLGNSFKPHQKAFFLGGGDLSHC